MKSEKTGSFIKDYVLIEEMERTWVNKSLLAPTNADQTIQNGRSKALKILTFINNQNSKNCGGQRAVSNKRRDIRLLQNHEKIMEAQDKWTGNGRFIIKNKRKFTVINQTFLIFIFINFLTKNSKEGSK